MELLKEFHKLSSTQRLHSLDIPVIGWTGGIATGKSTASNFLKNHGVAVIDADEIVKSLYGEGRLNEFIRTNVPDAISNESIDFAVLRKEVFSNDELKSNLEQTIYALMPEEFKKRIPSGAKFIVYDVPLLFEKSLDQKVDLKVCVYCPRETQIERIQERDGSPYEVIENILNSQWDIEKKAEQADHVIDNTKKMTDLEKSVEEFVSKYFSI